jgi:hypothetical protein
VPDWRPVRRVAESFRSFAEAEKGHLIQLLSQSDKLLEPLREPLRLPFHNHRWLDLQREREETYSDWLAWLLSQMPSTGQVLKIFGLGGTEFGLLVSDSKPVIAREEEINSRDGEKKRLDIVIRFGDLGILLVEVKVRPIEQAGGAENLPIYLHWLKMQPAMARYAVILVPESIDAPCDGWDVRTWEEVSLALRAQALSLSDSESGDLLVPSLLLCFAGAVEQNVLGLTGSESTLAVPLTSSYVERFLKENQS